MDKVTPEKRSEIMARIRGKDTKPEWTIRKLLFSMGYRYRLHVKALPGKPDLVFPRRRKVVFVHGCFWHAHSRCGRARMPVTRADFWEAKLRRNQERDAAQRRELRRLGWDVFVVWECEMTSVGNLSRRLQRFLDDN